MFTPNPKSVYAFIPNRAIHWMKKLRKMKVPAATYLLVLFLCLAMTTQSGCRFNERAYTLTIHIKSPTELELIGPRGKVLEKAKSAEQMYNIIKLPKYLRMIKSDYVIYRAKAEIIDGPEMESGPIIELMAKLFHLGVTGGKFERTN